MKSPGTSVVKDVVTIALLIFVFALLYVPMSDPIYDVDQIGYVEGARSILQHRGYVVPRGYDFDLLLKSARSGFQESISSPTFGSEVRPILYGYVLAGFMRLVGEDPSRLSLLSNFCGLWSLLMIYLISRRHGNRTEAIFVVAMTGLCYFFWRASISVMTESLATALGITGVALFLASFANGRGWLLAGAGAFFGLSTAARPQQFVLGVAAVSVYLIMKKGIPRNEYRAVLVGGLLFCACLVPQYLYTRGKEMLYAHGALFRLEYFWLGDGGDAARPPWQVFAYAKSFLLGGQLIFPLASILLLIGVGIAIRKGPWESRFLLLWLLSTFALLSMERYFSLRYVFQAVVPGYLLSGYGLSWFRTRLELMLGAGRGWRLGVFLAASLISMSAAISAFGVISTIRVHRLRVAPFTYLRSHSMANDIVLGPDGVGRFHSPRPFFPLSDRLEDLAQVVAAARSAGRSVFIVLRTHRAARAESQYSPRSEQPFVQKYVEELGGERIWEESTQPPLSRWLPSEFVEELSESWEILAFRSNAL